MASSATAIDLVLRNEGTKVIPDDNGRGASKYGITSATAREFGLGWDDPRIHILSIEDAKYFYFVYWTKCKAGLLNSQEVADKFFDLAVNMGMGTSAKILQQAVGTKADGIVGAETADAANSMDPEALLAKMRSLAADHYQALVDKNPDLARFLPGWLSRLNA